jgi:predicted glycoside hydrolase/deacetylase ChbG (UPF0249 family)
VVPFKDDESLRLLRQLGPAVRIGAHLTYIEVPFLTRPAPFPDGAPPADYRSFLVAYLSGKIRPDEVLAEWRAQLDLLRARIDRPVSHLDGHQHLHIMPGLWRSTRILQREYGVELVRRPVEVSRRAWLKDFPMGAGLQALALSRTGPTAERFFGVGTSMGFSADLYRATAAEIARHPQRRYELMVHPAEDQRGRREVAELERFLAFFSPAT